MITSERWRLGAMLKHFKAVLVRWEVAPFNAGVWFTSLLGLAVIRNLLEALLEADHHWTMRTSLREGLSDQVHSTSAWICVYLLSTLSISTLLQRPLLQVSNVTLRAFALILIVPLFDALLGHPGQILYQFDFVEFYGSYLGLFLPWKEVSYVTTGVKIEIFLAVLFSMLYVALTNRGSRVEGIWKAIVAGLFMYNIPFLLAYLPAVWSFLFDSTNLAMMGQSVLGVTSAEAALIWYLPIFIPALLYFLKMYSTQTWTSILDCLRPSRLCVYLLLLNAGFLIATRDGLVGDDWINPYDIGELCLLNLALIAAFVSQVALNDYFDQEIDRLSNSSRPLASDKGLESSYLCIAISGAFLASLLSVVVDDVCIYPMLAILFLGWFYSAPPFRLRRFVGLGHLILAALGTTCLLLGASLVHGNLSYQLFDRSLLGVIAALYFAAVHFKDIKDIEGDRAHGVSSLATLFGARVAYIITGFIVISVALLGVQGKLLPHSPLAYLALVGFTLAWIILKDSEKIMRILGILLFLMLAAIISAR